MKQSRRLMVILPPGSGPESESAVSLQPPVIGGYDWQVGVSPHSSCEEPTASVVLHVVASLPSLKSFCSYTYNPS